MLASARFNDFFSRSLSSPWQPHSCGSDDSILNFFF